MTGAGPERDRGVYGIAVAGELVGMPIQSLRLYEARGLLKPERTEGGTRRYSANDVERLRRIGELVDAGLNLAGVAMVLDLEQQNSELQEGAGAAPHRSPSTRPGGEQLGAVAVGEQGR